jgi:predicted acetylornithine/succinylornithine family transaminase
MNLAQAQQIDAECFFTLYTRTPLMITRGAGMYVWDDQGQRYLDFCSGGRAVNALGHCHPRVVAAIRAQAEILLHTSNDFYTEPQAQLARLLTSHCVCNKIFFCNSGGEANEAALKLARKYGKRDSAERYEVVSTLQSFHGRTMGAISATGQPKYQQGFEPLVPGFRYVPYNDLAAMAEVITARTCAVILEPVQGESGVYPATPEYLQGVRRLCDERGAALILDEVQTGLGRTGKLFAYEHYGIEPDIITLSKAIGGGVPLGAMLAKNPVAAAFKPGDHATTFGGTAIAAAAGFAAVSAILDEGLVENAAAIGYYLADKLDALSARSPHVSGYRAIGCMAAIDLADPIAAQVQTAARAQGLLILTVGATMLRLLPALICTTAEVDQAMEIIANAIDAAAPVTAG